MKENKKSVSTKSVSSHCKESKEEQEDFIMLPTVDFCFKELMQNDNIRKNIIAALLNVPSGEVENTELMPTILRKESKDDKYGILDVRVKLKNGEQIDFEMQVEAFDCWANRSVYYLSKMYTLFLSLHHRMQFSDNTLYHLENDRMQECSHGYTSSSNRIPRLLLFHLYTSYLDNKQIDFEMQVEAFAISSKSFLVFPPRKRIHCNRLVSFFSSGGSFEEMERKILNWKKHMTYWIN